MLNGGTKWSIGCDEGSGCLDRASARAFFSPLMYWISLMLYSKNTVYQRDCSGDISACSVSHCNEQWSVLQTNGKPTK